MTDRDMPEELVRLIISELPPPPEASPRGGPVLSKKIERRFGGGKTGRRSAMNFEISDDPRPTERFGVDVPGKFADPAQWS